MTHTPETFARAAAAAEAAHRAWAVSPLLRHRYDHDEARFVADSIAAAAVHPAQPVMTHEPQFLDGALPGVFA